jgi:hypothetical protein
MPDAIAFGRNRPREASMAEAHGLPLVPEGIKKMQSVAPCEI